MARTPSVWFREHDGYFYTTINGVKIKLSRDRKEADRLFHERMAARKDEVREARRPTFRAVADDFLAHSQASNKPSTFELHRRFLQSFCDQVKNRRVADLRGEHVTAWLKANPTWGKSTRSLAIQIVKAAISYAKLEGKVAVHSLEEVKVGTMRHRERILTAEEREKINAHVAGTPFGEFLFVLEQTGMRPFSEAAKVTAAMVDWEKGSITFKDHKNAKKGKRRVVFLAKPALEKLRELSGRHPDGPLLQRKNGGGWDRINSHQFFRRLKKNTGIQDITAYTWRHDYISRAIVNGVPLPLLAELVGNSVRILLANYSHMATKTDALREAAARAIL